MTVDHALQNSAAMENDCAYMFTAPTACMAKPVICIFVLLTEISFRTCNVCVCVYSTHGYHVKSGQKDGRKEMTFNFCVGEISDLVNYTGEVLTR